MRVYGDPEVMRFGDGPQTPEWVRDWIRRALACYEQRGYGPWAVIEKHSGELIGYCGLFFYPDINGRPEIEIGYRLARAWWGRGYATEAVTAVRDFAFDTLGLSRLVALIDPANVASVRVAEKAGMRHEADVMLVGYDHPDRVYVVRRPSSPLLHYATLDLRPETPFQQRIAPQASPKATSVAHFTDRP